MMKLTSLRTPLERAASRPLAAMRHPALFPGGGNVQGGRARRSHASSRLSHGR
jgi:hypothetical protein